MCPIPSEIRHVIDGRRWSLREDVQLDDRADVDDVMLVHTPWNTMRVEHPGPTVRTALHRMTLGPVRLANVPVAVQDRSGGPVCLQLKHTLDRISCAVVHSLVAPDTHRPLLSVQPVTPQARFRLGRVDGDATVRLARRATLSGSGGSPALTAPRAHFEVLLEREPAVEMVSILERPSTITALASALDTGERFAADAVSFLLGAGLATRCDRHRRRGRSSIE